MTSTSAESSQPTVTAPCGTVRGLSDGEVDSYLGIPYAQPMTGAAAFQAPRPLESLPGGEFAATSFGPPCPQFMPAGDIPMEEHRDGDDWLSLNVWTPAQRTQGQALPVMVWIHGGAYVLGSSAEPQYNGTVFARERCVFVSINYRLGLEGFLQLDGAAANRGLLDQIAALNWVRDNIATFGGDPQRVTVFGESAGAGAIHCLLTMPDAQGLFQRAILQSPPSMVLEADLAAQITNTAVRAAGQMHPEAQATPEFFGSLSLTERRAVLEELNSTAKRSMGSWGAASAFEPPLTPMVDGTVLPRGPWKALRSTPPDIPVIIGSNAEEFNLFMALARSQPNEAVAQRILGTIGPRTQPESEQYAHLVTAPEGTARPPVIYERVNTDFMFTVPALDMAQAIPGAWTYLLEADPRGGIQAAHSVDLPLLFENYTDGMGALTFPQGPTERERRTGRRMRDAWLRFARTGRADWPEFSHDGATRVFDAHTDEERVLPHPLLERWKCFVRQPATPHGLL